jgi:hypothetical protein
VGSTIDKDELAPRRRLKPEGAGAFKPLNESLNLVRGFNPGIKTRNEPGLQLLKYASLRDLQSFGLVRAYLSYQKA